MPVTRTYHRKDVSTDEIVRLYKSGLGSNAIGRRFNASQTFVIRRLQRAGVIRRKIREYVPNFVDTADIIRMYTEGLSTLEIAKRTGITKHAVLVRLVRAGIPRRTKSDYSCPSGADHPLWKGGRFTERNGYIVVNTGPCQRQLEHRVVMERVLGRRLKQCEYVHHINGIRHDNRPENLVVTTPTKHETQTLIKALQRRICYLESVLKEAQVQHA